MKLRKRQNKQISIGLKSILTSATELEKDFKNHDRKKDRKYPVYIDHLKWSSIAAIFLVGDPGITNEDRKKEAIKTSVEFKCDVWINLNGYADEYFICRYDEVMNTIKEEKGKSFLPRMNNK
ncbi:hypothetical protein LCGC14_1008840 [marine sediment metagenome]|uniref:Uncharacterized protein n=1 Tax=marine sediment metagenome TaxID=412755 RepID=A0A0F9QJ47_9ZZZZ